MLKRQAKKYGKEVVWGIEKMLSFLFEFAEYMTIPEISKTEVYRGVYRVNRGHMSKKQISTMFYRLKKQNYIASGSRDNSIVLTNKAKIRLVEKSVAKKMSDGLLRFLSFDIPERLHTQRDNFRKAIKRIGFRQIQQSLWVTDKDISDEIELVIKYYRLEDYVAYIVAQETNIDLMIKNILLK